MMRQRHLIGGLIILAAVILNLAAMGPARAAPTASPKAVAATRPAREITKVTLADTSIAAPAFWSVTSGPVRGVLAWTGTDAAHHLNVMTSSIGTTYGHKIVLPETSNMAPAVVRMPNGAVVIAWTGMDGGRTLNVLYDVYGAHPQKLTLWGEASGANPALAVFKGNLLLAWTGLDSGHRPNVLTILTGTTLQAGIKTTLWQYSAASAPGLSLDPNGQQLILSWATVSPANRVSFALSQDGTRWSTPPVSPLAETTYSAPNMIGIAASAMPLHYLAWTGTDSARSVNVQYSESFPGWTNPTVTKAILPETALDAPALGFIGGSNLMLLTWTGTDPTHHLNVAVLAATAPCTPPPGVSPVSPDVIVSGNTSKPQVTLTIDAGGEDGVRATRLLDILRSHQVHATWFITGEWAQDHRDLVRRVVTDGNEIGGHTVDHADLKTPPRSDDFICYQVTQGDQLVADAAGVSTRPFFRPPNGSYNDQVRYRAAGLGFRTVYWTIDTRDWDPNITRQDILNRIFNSPYLKPGAIILMHAGSLHEPEALDEVIAGLQQRGFTIVTLSQLIG